MAGRHHLPHNNCMKLRDGILSQPTLLIEDPRLLHHLVQLPSSSSSTRVHTHAHPSLTEEKIALNHREIQSLLGDNQRLAATHVALKQELAHAQLELHELSSAAARLKVDRDNQVRDVYERSLKMDAELRSVDAMSADLTRVSVDVRKLNATKQELDAELNKIEGDIVKIRSELDKFPAIKADIDVMRQEVQRGRQRAVVITHRHPLSGLKSPRVVSRDRRSNPTFIWNEGFIGWRRGGVINKIALLAAIEFEKKTHASNNAHRQAMEKNKIIINREIEKLRAELESAENRATAAAAAATNPTVAAYAANYGNPVVEYGGHPYRYPYDMHQVPVGAQAIQQQGFRMGPYGPYDMQQPNVHR